MRGEGGPDGVDVPGRVVVFVVGGEPAEPVEGSGVFGCGGGVVDEGGVRAGEFGRGGVVVGAGFGGERGVYGLTYGHNLDDTEATSW